MAKMRVVAVKMSSEPISIKIVYEKNGSMYMRTGADGFSVGKPLKHPLVALINKWGFRKVSNPPEFRDAEEIVDNITGFELRQDGKIVFSG